MKNLHYGENINSYNENSCRELAWAIEASFGEFSLIFVRCNYASLRENTVQQLRQICAFEIREVHLNESDQTLYSTIKNNLGDEQPLAVMVFALESVIAIEKLLTTTNSVREEFRKNFSFPLVLWINDDILQKLIRLAPDFETWSTTIEFIINDNELINLIQRRSDDIFAKLLEFGAGLFLDNAALNLGVGSPRRVELESAWRELIERKIVFSPELKASLEFVMGRDFWSSAEISRQYYENSLVYWRETHNLERQGCLLYCLGLWWRRYAEENHGEYKLALLRSKSYFEECITVFEQTEKPQLVAQFINALGAILHKLEKWEELEVIAQKALALHQVYYKPFRLARAYGFLAEVALAKSAWMEAKQLAEKALSTMRIGFVFRETQDEWVRSVSLDWIRSYHQGWYLLALGQSLFSLNQIPEAIQVLETAKLETKPNYDPSLYLGILEKLRQSYFQEGEYLTAFQVKQQQRSIEQQYSLRAFIGAGRLQPKQRVVNPSLPPVEKPREVAQEIAASGRQQDVDRLVERMRRHDCKLTVIHGQSGVGKSSIIKAGFIPALQQKPINSRTILPICQRVYTDWIKELGQRLAKALRNLGNVDFPNQEFDSTTAIIQELGMNCDQNLLTVLIFDQFEEFFFVCKEPNQRHEFYDFLRNCLDIPYLKVVLSLREDYLHYLLEFNRLTDLEVISNNILDKNILYYLGNFSVADTKRIIQDLTRQTQFYLEPKLVDRLVSDLSQELNEVRPIELQVVGTQLQTEKIVTLTQYQEYGSKERLVENFLEEAVKDCGVENEEFAQVVLYLLTDENNTRPIKTRTELEAGCKSLDLEVNSNQLDLILEILVGTRLVFLIPEAPNNRYQLVHDYLVAFIRQKQESGLVKELKKEKEYRQETEAELSRVLKRQLKIAAFGLSLMSVITILAIVFWRQAEFQKQQAQIEQIQALTATSKALFHSNKQLEALINSLKAAKRLRRVNAPLEVKNQTIDWLRQVYYYSNSLAITNNNVAEKERKDFINPLGMMYEIKEINRLEGHIGWVLDAAYSPDGKIIATAGRDQTVKIWNSKGSLIKSLSGHQARINQVIFSPDGQSIASASSDGTVKIWNRNGNLLRSINHGNKVYGVSFSPDNQIIATADKSPIIKLWNPQGTLWKTLTHGDQVYSVNFSPNGQIIATAGQDKTIKLWNLNGKLLRTLQGHNDIIFKVSFSHDGKLIASASADKTVKIWTLDGKLYKTLSGHNTKLYGVTFSPNSEIIATAGHDNNVCLWNRDGILLRTIKGHTNVINNINFSPDSKMLISASDDATARIWSLNKDNPTVKVLTGHKGAVWGVSFSPDGQVIASASDDRTIKIWQLNGNLQKTLIGHKDKVLNVTFSPDSKVIASASADKTIKLWRRDGSLITTIAGHSNSVHSVIFSSDGQMIASGSADKTVKLWTRNGQLLKTFRGHSEPVWQVSFSKNDRIIASASEDGTIKLWRRDGNLIKTLRGHTNEVNGIRFSPDGEIIASASSDTTIKLWSKKGDLLKTLAGHNGMANDVVFSPNGRLIASAGRDDTVKIWTYDGRLLLSFDAYTMGVLSVNFSPDSRILASSGGDGTIKLWRSDIPELNFKLDDLLVRGCTLAKDYLENNSNVTDRDTRLLCDDVNSQK